MQSAVSKRLPAVLAGLMTLALLAPGAAVAHGGHHRRHHMLRGHHDAHVSFLHLGPAISASSTTGSTTSTSADSNQPSTTTTTTSSTSTPANAGEVASYTGGALTLTLTDGSSLSGQVTAATRIECISATTTPPSGDQDDEGAPGDDNGPGDDQGEGDRNQGGNWQGDQGQGGDSQWQDDNNGDDDDQADLEAPIVSEPPCDSGALVKGATVRAAELRIAPGGAEFEIIVLVR